ncbi:MAG: tRNA pseudouridine(13) synthase TruD [Thiohalocapsa sp.]
MTTGEQAASPSLAPPVWRPFDELPRAHGEPLLSCRLRACAEDFVVDEILAFGADGDGEHVLLRVRKTDANTEWAARRLASVAGVPAKAVGFAGMKDRHAVTTQWFSVHLGPRPEPRWNALAAEGIEVLESHRHRRKLRRGVLAGNRFELRLRDVRGDLDALARRIDQIALHGVPNYFGPQRFGRDQGNLYHADELFRSQAQGTGDASRGRQRRRPSRHVTGLWLSAARSQLFNEVLARRVERRDWHQALSGERLQLSGSHSHFLAEVVDAGIRARVDSGDVQPTGPLFGAGELLTSAEVAAIESDIAASFQGWIDGLAAAGLKQERRPLVLLPEELVMERIDATPATAAPPPADATGTSPDLLLRFTLPAGSYATALLREFAIWTE